MTRMVCFSDERVAQLERMSATMPSLIDETEITALPANDPTRLNRIVNDWHESGRASFESQFQALDWDSPMYRHSWKEHVKYVYLDEGGAGAFMLDKTNGYIYNIKGYGVPNFKKRIGHIDTVTGKTLARLRWNYHYR